MSGVVEQHAGTGNRVFAIEWHVDYWDYLGHPDPFASELFTERQEAYAIATNAEYLFTPQLMVNTNTLQSPTAGNADNAIASALGEGVQTSLTMWQDDEVPGLVVHYKVKDAPPDAMLHLVMVEGGIVREIAAGENAGKTLHHSAAARWYATVPAERSWVTVGYSPDVVLANARFIGFLQSPGSMELHAAAMLETLVPTQ